MVEGPVGHLINFHVVKRCALWDIGDPFRTETIEPNQLLSLSVKSSQIETVTEGVEFQCEGDVLFCVIAGVAVLGSKVESYGISLEMIGTKGEAEDQ